MIYVVMGVSGCGKSSIGRRLSKALQCPFYDADNFHSEASIKKMSEGIPLNDEDRQPWLERLAQEMLRWDQDGDAVLACSALKQKYRDTLSSTLPDKVKFVYLKGDKKTIGDRMRRRTRHFMNPNLLDSQFQALEEPRGAIEVPVRLSPDKVVRRIVEVIRA